jgi:calcineurin-like phosphoesterase family protein
VIWFTSDPHYFHKNVIRMCKRPFATLHEMHEHMIQEWNKRVKSQEKVYCLGDFAFSGWTLTKTIVRRLNGHKILVLGNHDLAAHKMLATGFQEVHENHWIEIGNKQKVYLSHYPFHPMNAYGKYPDGKVVLGYPYDKVDTRYMHKRMVDDGESWLLHGHVHNAWLQNGRQINVGVDVWDFKPVPHEKILQLIEKGPKFDGNSDTDYGD